MPAAARPGRMAGGALTLTAACAAIWSAAAQTIYPVKPIELIVPFVAGGTTDTISRMIAQRFTDQWGQTVIVSNRPGGGSTIGTLQAAKSKIGRAHV